MATKKTNETKEPEVNAEALEALEKAGKDNAEADKDAKIRELEELLAKMQEKLQTQEEPAEEPAKAEEPQEDPWKKMMKVRPPRQPNNGLDYYYVCVNDVRFQIPADGREYEVPEPIGLALMDSVEAEAWADDYAKKLEQESYDPVLRPKPMN